MRWRVGVGLFTLVSRSTCILACKLYNSLYSYMLFNTISIWKLL